MIKSFFRFFSPVKHIKGHFIKCTVHAFFIALYSVFCIEIFGRILAAIEVRDEESFYNYLSIYFIVSVAFILGRLLFGWKMGWGPILYDGAKTLSKEYLEKYVEGDGNYTEKIGTGKFISIIESGVYTWLDLIHKVSRFGTINITLMLYSIYRIFLIDVYYGGIAVLMTVIGVIGSTLANIKMRNARLVRWAAKNEITRGIVKVLMSKNELLQNNAVEKEAKKLWPYMEDAKVSQYTVSFWFNALEDIPRFIFVVLRIVVYIFLLKQVIESNASMSDIGVFILVMAFMEKSTDNILQVSREILKDSFQMTKLWDTFDQLPKIKGYDTGKTFTPQKGNIVLENILYKYDTNEVFKNFSLEIKQGQKTALVGMSGAGKTTLMKLIAGYLHPQKGSVIVQGQKLEKTALKSYFPHIGYLTQEPGVFDGSIKENLLASNPLKTSEQELKEALINANCEFVFGFKDAMETQIGERGVRLSGGQKQRLAIAKVFLKDPQIILLDEPTSALDSFSEEKITEALERLFKGRTVVIVAHRLQTVKKADDIIVLKNGEVKERGAHNELLKLGGIYTQMIELQSGF